MSATSLPEFCFERLSKEIPLQCIKGLDDIEKISLPSGEDGGGIKAYTGDRISKVTMVEFKLGEGVPVPHHDNRLCIGAEIFQIVPDLNYKLPAWGINSVIMKDGNYYFDTDFSFGFDLVYEYEYVKEYIAPFNDTYQAFANNPDLKMVSFYDSTPWVRTYISPLFFSAIAKTDKLDPVFKLAEAMIEVWLNMFRHAEKDDNSKKNRQERLKARSAGSKDSDRMGKVLLEAYGRETFSKFFKAMT